jgi:hypothetical protein
MDHCAPHRRRSATDSAFRGVRFAAAAISLALAVCGAGGGEASGSEEPRAAEGARTDGRQAAEAESRSAESAEHGEPAANGTKNGAVAEDAPEGADSGEERPAQTNGSAETRAATRMAMRPPPSPPPDPADPVADAPPPALPETLDLSPEEAIERACDPPVGAEVRSLASCGDVARAHQGLMERNRACRRDEDCRVLEGSCEIGLGGCWYPVNRKVGYADADALAARYRDLACGGPVCRCAPPPERSRCRQGVCAAAN